MRIKRYGKNLLVFLTLLFVTEVVLKLKWGFGSPVLFLEDTSFEYIAKPNQGIKRFGNRIKTNEFSMRSEPISASDSIVILKIGDSIINGGTLTDQDSLATTILEKKLREEFKKNIRVLNISAGSWGPDNAFAYIKKYGAFKSKFFILVFSSHDLYDVMQFDKVVGVNPSFPSENPCCAISELVNRYGIPWLEEKTGISLHKDKIQNNFVISYNTNKINPGWKEFIDYTRLNNIKLSVVLHPTIQEVEMQHYDENGKKIISMLDSANIYCLKEINPSHIPLKDCYRDDIHYNNKGQKLLAEEVYPLLKDYILGLR